MNTTITAAGVVLISATTTITTSSSCSSEMFMGCGREWEELDGAAVERMRHQMQLHACPP